MEQAFAITAANPQKRRRIDPESINQDELEVLYVRAIAATNLPFRLVECPEFCALLIYLNKDVGNTLAKSHTDVRKWVIRQYNGMKGIVRNSLYNAQSKIYISLDL